MFIFDFKKKLSLDVSPIQETAFFLAFYTRGREEKGKKGGKERRWFDLLLIIFRPTKQIVNGLSDGLMSDKVILIGRDDRLDKKWKQEAI